MSHHYDTVSRATPSKRTREVTILSDDGKPEVKNASAERKALALLTVPLFWLPAIAALLAWAVTR
ncbi:MAG: hypothetical protein ACTJFR_01225 [Canibacter sp.]